MPWGLAKKTRRRMEAALEFIKARRCVTVAALAKELGVGWDNAKRIADMLRKEGKVVVVTFGGKMFWCIDEGAAEEAVNEVRMETWRLICNAKFTHVYPARLARLVMEDVKAMKVFTKYVSIDDLLKAGGLKFLNAVLNDTLGEAVDRRTHHKVYAVPPNFCTQPPPRAKPKIYKPPHSIVTFWVGEEMLQDIEKAAEALGVDKPRLIRMAIERMLEQYRHVDNGAVSFLVPKYMAEDIEKATVMLGISKEEFIRAAIMRLLEQYKHLL